MGTKNINDLCQGSTKPTQPGECFNKVMNGHVKWEMATNGNGRMQYTYALEQVILKKPLVASNHVFMQAQLGKKQSCNAN